ncbi:cobalt-precorrin-6A reductase [Hydrogenophaga intermedia]|uniref:cobalt-precorrin-6A reductase n=1 Tax=Hydrogenophaga intermedia TaxID=65786 RepID=UPI0020430D8F|nr:cobalt-precorrin-6A reductase [Hydrogenophaga intermedia]MCM3566030.1 cobalt-precorrin-6A reductase [Hydrogenophaga intermedia]
MRKILLLGGTSEASALAGCLAERGENAVLSYAGRVSQPKAQPIPVRIGGFGGVPGLVRYLQEHHVTHLVDATHPFATQMSRHAVEAAQQTGIALLALTRPPWRAGPGDRWQAVPDMAAAVAALAGPPKRVLLALGRLHCAEFAAQPQHHYILRLVDAPIEPPALPHHTVVVSRGPFGVSGDLALMRRQGVDIVVAKNAGGVGAEAKLHAARSLGLPVVMVERPPIAHRREASSVAQVLEWLDHSPGARDAVRGV